MQAFSSQPKPRPAQAPISGGESDSESDYSSSDVTEDEDGEELTPALDAAILRTLSKIKNKEGVYGKENVLQEELQRAQEKANAQGIKSGVTKKSTEKPYLLQDYHRAKLLSGNINEQEEEEEPLTFVQQSRKIRDEAVSAFKSLVDDDNDDSDNEDSEGFIKKREKDEKEENQEDEEYRKFLLDMGGGEDEVRKILGMGDQTISLALEENETQAAQEQSKKADPATKVEKEKGEEKKKAKKAKKAKNDDEFLMNYILNRGWIDRTDNHVPTYKEVIGDDESDDEKKEEQSEAGPSSHPWGKLDEEDEFDDKADAFEAEYNFRFEEPGSSNIVSHPRQIESLVRRPDDARKTKRARRAERKALEKAKQEEELKAKKGSKRREMEKRMLSLKSDLAAEGINDNLLDWDSLEKVLDGEWDENEWEKVVGGMLSNANQEDGEDENGKPTWEDDLDDIQYDDEEGEGEGGFAYDQQVVGEYDEDDQDGRINMDADFVDEEPSKKKRKRDKKNKKNKNKVNDVEMDIREDVDKGSSIMEKAKQVKKVMEEYKELEFEDIIGEIKTKFKYHKSQPISYGLTATEILLSTDEELNKIFSVKNLAPYKKNNNLGIQGKGLSQRIKELKDDLKNRKWGQDEYQQQQAANKKRKHAEEINQENGNDNGEKKRSGKRQGKKERKRSKLGKGDNQDSAKDTQAL
ncbi:uncharacterized protein L201_007851 [Kwoniella dendrophila CBS 6074]|uniref:Kri1-like C-terminal domain-containing protein n=1 Tax=Kwoniella dendrophila CBS 6074 TaxID=1295534 RepID=A0AAX4K6X2_9TREE